MSAVLCDFYGIKNATVWRSGLYSEGALLAQFRHLPPEAVRELPSARGAGYQDMTRAKQQKGERRAGVFTIPPACLFDWEASDQLRCLVCRDHRLLLLLPERRAAMLALLLKQGQLCGRAKGEAERL